jgi:hypothetical protein
MSIAKTARPAFQSVELDPIDAKLEAKAAEKGIPTLVATSAPRSLPPSNPKSPGIDTPDTATLQRSYDAASGKETPRRRVKGFRVELPDYVWIELKKQSAERMVSLRYFLMEALRAKGIHIDDADMGVDGRRIRD